MYGWILVIHASTELYNLLFLFQLLIMFIIKSIIIY